MEVNTMSQSTKRKVKSKAKRIKWLLIIGVIIAIPISIVWYGWTNTFFVIIPPDTVKTFPDGVIIWSYYDNRADRFVSVDFIQEIDLETLTVLTYNHIAKDFKPMLFPYSERIHKFVSVGIGESLNDVFLDEKPEEKQEPEVKPHIEELDDWEINEAEMC